MDILLKNIRYLISMADGEPTVSSYRSVWADNGRIMSVEPAGASSASAATEIDCTGLIAVPGFVNAHHHMYQTFLRGIATSDGLDGWFDARQELIRRLGPKERFHAVSLGHLELLGNGTTTVCEFASNNRDAASIDATLDALEDSPLAVVVAYSPPEEAGEELTRVHRRLCGSPYLRTLLCVPAPIVPDISDSRAVTEFSRLTDFAATRGIGLTTHALETEGDRDGKPIEVLRQTGALRPGTLLAHMVHASPEEIALVAASGCAVVHNPLSNMRLATGIMPLVGFMSSCVGLALGTDGGCNDSADMFETMKVAMGLQRAATRNAGACGPLDVLRMATIGGATALGLADETGSIEPGKRADIVVLDPSTARFGVIHDPVAQVVLNASPAEVRHVIAGGTVVKRDWRTVCVDEDRIVKLAQQCFTSFLSHP